MSPSNSLPKKRFKATDGKKGRIVVGSRSTDRRRSQSKKGRKYSPSRSSSKKINNKSKRKHSKSGSVARERSKSLRKSKDPPIVRNQNLIHYHDKKGSKESKKGRWVPEDGSQTRPAKRRRHSSPSRSKKSRSSSYNRKDTEKINSIRITVEDKNREVRSANGASKKRHNTERYVPPPIRNMSKRHNR